MRQKLLRLLIAIGLLGVCAWAQKTSSVQGVVVTLGPDGDRSAVAGAKITLDGPAYITAESNGEGKFVINGVPQGSYEITAKSPGMTADRNIEIFPGTVSEVMLWMKLETVNDSVTVTGEPMRLTRYTAGSVVMAISANNPTRHHCTHGIILAY